MIISRVAVMGLILAGWGGLSAGEVMAERFYVELATGVSIVPDQDLEGGVLSVSADPGFLVGGALGIRVNDYLRTEVNLGYRQSEVDEIAGQGLVLEGAGSVGVFAALANVYIDLLPDAPLIPFVGAGIGVGVVTVDSDDDANVLIIDDSSVELAWNVMAGASVPITDRFALSLAYRYLAVTDPELEATVVGVGTGTLEGEFDAHEIMFGARFGF